MEVQAQEYLKQKNWSQAIDFYNKLLGDKNNTLEQVISYLTDRAECYLELNDHHAVITDSKNVIKLSQNRDCYNVSLARKRLLHSLFVLKMYAEADLAAKDWLIYLQESDLNKEIKVILENLLSTFINCSHSKQKTLSLLPILDSNFSSSYVISTAKESPLSSSSASVSCIYCNVSFSDKSELRLHCQTEKHEMMVMSDDGHDWYSRPPPRGFKSDSYVLCENWRESGSCRYGTQCVRAHGEDELNEWKERFRYREMRLQRAREKEMFGKSYTEELLEKWAECPNPGSLMQNNLDDVEDECSCALSVTVSSKNSQHDWDFYLKTCRPLKAVSLLQDTHRNHFFISCVYVHGSKVDLKNDQEWISTAPHQDRQNLLQEYKIRVVFTTGIFGTFRQSVVFDFASEPVLVKHLCVDVVPDRDLDKINEIRKEISISLSERWTIHNSEIVQFQSSLNVSDDWEKHLKTLYPCPRLDTFLLSHATLTEKKFTRNNYRERMHELLFVEEMARYELIARYNLTAKLQLAHSYILSPNSMAASTAKYSSNGELFASVSLGKELSEDTSEGRLILMHCGTVFLCPPAYCSDPGQQKRRVYEAVIEDKGKNVIYLRISSQTVHDLRLSPDCDLEVDIQFQLNRVPYCEWHYVLDKMQHFKSIFPETYLEPNIPWSPSRQWPQTLDGRLNVKQKEAVRAITTPLEVALPPILVIGPFGTGKTFTLAQAVKELIKEDENRILLCTHSNSAADLYIKEYFDKWVVDGEEAARPLRIYYVKRWVTTVSPVVQKYCLIANKGNVRTFQVPTIEDVTRHKIIVVTLSTSVYLSAMGLPQGFFTHILLDEAAQAIECETVTPLAVATDTTRIVLAGDHMQLGPDIFSTFAKERELHISLLERLYDHYPTPFPCKILLCENYRAHESIVQFTSESFYDQKLISSSKQPRHSKFYPLTFFTTRGEDVQDKNSTAYYNNSEVYEVVERVAELKRNWPTEWEPYDDNSIGVVTPYSDQVFRIRSELRKRRIDNVCVERVLNVQGKQFRAIVLSTVRTRKTCTNDSTATATGAVSAIGEIDYGFLSNSKLLNTAITRAQSLVAVVGDPIALCSLGRCSKVWEKFIQVCKENESLFGITWTQLKLQLDGIELKKVYTLNPLAPEFVPRMYRRPVGIPPPKTCEPSTPYPMNVLNQQPPLAVQPTPQFDYRVIQHPVVYPQPQPRPFLFNIVPPVHQIQPQLTNGVVQRMPNRPFIVPLSVQTIKNLPHESRQIQSNNKLIQFMNNVHFPEASVLNDCINLLPQNMSLADMLLQPANMQEKWYNYLKETTGPEAAEKFKYLLHTTNQKKGSKVMDKMEIFSNERSTPQSCDSPTFNWYDSPSNQINFNKPVYMTENLPGEVVNVKRNGDSDIQRHINEEFGNLNVSSTDINEVFKAFTFKNCPSSGGIYLSGTDSSEVPRFYKYFQ